MKFCHDDEWLAAYLDKRMSEKDRRLYEVHLASCPSCLADLVNAKAELDEVEAEDLRAPAGEQALPARSVVAWARSRLAGSKGFASPSATTATRTRVLAIGLSVVVFFAGALFVVGSLLPARKAMRTARENVSRILATTEISAMRLSNGPAQPVERTTLYRGPVAPDRDLLQSTEATLRALADGSARNWRARHLLGELYLATGQTDRAEVFFDESMKLRPDDARLLNDCAVFEYRLARFDSCRAHLERARALDDDEPLILYNLGILCRDLGEIEQSRRHFESYLAKDPSSKWAERARTLSSGG